MIDNVRSRTIAIMDANQARLIECGRGSVSKAKKSKDDDRSLMDIKLMAGPNYEEGMTNATHLRNFDKIC